MSILVAVSCWLLWAVYMCSFIVTNWVIPSGWHWLPLFYVKIYLLYLKYMQSGRNKINWWFRTKTFINVLPDVVKDFFFSVIVAQSDRSLHEGWAGCFLTCLICGRDHQYILFMLICVEIILNKFQKISRVLLGLIFYLSTFHLALSYNSIEFRILILKEVLEFKIHPKRRKKIKSEKLKVNGHFRSKDINSHCSFKMTRYLLYLNISVSKFWLPVKPIILKEIISFVVIVVDLLMTGCIPMFTWAGFEIWITYLIFT